jgi:hypothetical protein
LPGEREEGNAAANVIANMIYDEAMKCDFGFCFTQNLNYSTSSSSSFFLHARLFYFTGIVVVR